MQRFSSALNDRDGDAVARTFLPTGWLRDSLTFTWDNRSLSGRCRIASYLADTLPFVQISNVHLSKDPAFVPVSRTGSPESVEFGFTYETALAWGRGFVRLVHASDDWLALTASTIVSDLKGHEEAPLFDWEEETGERTWGELQAELRAQAESCPKVLIGMCWP